MASPLLRPRWIVGTLLVSAIVGGCISAGFWQLRRLDERRDTNDRIRRRSATTVPLPPAGFAEGADADQLVFRGVTVVGTFDPSHEVLARFRSRRGLPGYEVVTPLRPAGTDATLLVVRGWVPLADGDRWPVPSMAPPAGEVQVTGLLAPAEGGPTRLERRDGGPDVVTAIDPPELASAVGADRVYALPLLAESGAADAGASFPVPVEPPDLSEGSHRSYAVQWFGFASVGTVGWVLLVLRRGRQVPGLPAGGQLPGSTHLVAEEPAQR